MTRERKSARGFISVLVFCIGSLVGSLAHAQPVVQMSGNVSYSHTANTAVLSVDRIDNSSVDQGLSSNLRLELWAFPQPFAGLNQQDYAYTGHLMASYDLGQLRPGFYVVGVNSGAVPFTPPPAGTWWIAMVLTDSNGASYLQTDFRNFGTEFFSASPVQFAPQIGTWWNPGESGSGYNVDYKNGKLVVTVFSYLTNGAAQWYLASGPLVGTHFTAPLDTYASGQCISCAYAGPPVPTGNAGTITIDFTSTTTATVYLPGGRVTYIRPMVF